MPGHVLDGTPASVVRFKTHRLLVPMLEEAGVQGLNVMPGWYETRQPVNQMCVPKGAFVYAAERLKQVARIPIYTNIRITDPVSGEKVKIKPKKLPFFKCGKDLKDRVDK